MKAKSMKKILSRIAAVLSVVTVIVSSSVVMADAEIVTSSDFISTSYSHDYSRWASVIRSYLVGCDDGRLMRVYSGSKGYYVEYYDSDFNLLESKTIDKELSLFGGFYAGKDAYYIVSGQNNPDESANVECFRITKYDKNWNRITSTGLYDCNTYSPFDVGSLRMTEASGYLFIRTAHEMYKTKDGYHHQANVTIQLDESTMKITDSFTNVSNSSYGYVSHSFNQFIKTDGNHIIAVDHGDAYPRSLALIKYNTDFTEGQFCSNIRYWWDSNQHAVVNNSCDVTDLLTISGQIGDNTTNATIGGFEISNTSYIVAASSIDQEKQEGLRNIYILTQSKEDGTVKSNQITDISGKYNVTSPYLVKINNNKFMVMWTIKNDNTVYYAYIDENGKPKYYGRFNQGVVTINLVDVACSSKRDMNKFWQIFDERLDLCYRALMCRHERLKGTPSDVAPILWQHGALARLKKGETIDKLLYGGYSTISLGYAGLYECVKYMTGKSHTDPSATPFAIEVMQHLNDACAKWKEKENIDFSLYGTPIESTTYKFAKCLQKRFGKIEGVTDKNYITNSYHIHVTEHINAFDKLTFESQFQKLSPGGAISYVEVPDMNDNIPAVLSVICFL